MNADEYQVKARATAVYPKGSIDYCIHGLTNEAGEVAGAWKKYLRGDYKLDVVQDKIKKEVGDVLWYAAQLCTELNISLADVMKANLEKLADRQQRGVITGSGDNR